ncbi:MAG: hypothetical protein QXU99_07635 [Candidatus Bathyarchaeia archaeon]
MSQILAKIIAPVLLAVFLAGTIVETEARILTPGVEPGMTFTYDITSFWSSTDEYASIPQSLIEINKTKAFEVRIHNITDSNVTVFVAIYYWNGSAVADYGRIDLDSGTSYGGFKFAAIIAANLNARDVIHPLGTDGITINETVTRIYQSGSRETNRIIIESTNATTGASGSIDRYFDKATGVLVEEYETNISGDQRTTSKITWKLKETNVWVVPEFPSVLILPLVMALTVIAAIAIKKRQYRMEKLI